MSALFPFFADSSRQRTDISANISTNMLPATRSHNLKSDMNNNDIAKSYARIFASDDGKRVLDHMQISTLYRAYGPDSPDATLRHMEGQRYFLTQVLNHIERGRQGS